MILPRIILDDFSIGQSYYILTKREYETLVAKLGVQFVQGGLFWDNSEPDFQLTEDGNYYYAPVGSIDEEEEIFMIEEGLPLNMMNYAHSNSWKDWLQTHSQP